MQTILYVASIILVILSLVPFIREDYWIFRVFEYPRLQKFLLAMILIATILLFSFPETTWHWVVLFGSVCNLFYLGYLIFPYTVIAPRQIVDATRKDAKNQINILIANVYQENKQYGTYHDLIKKYGPDIVLLLETNNRWAQELEKLDIQFPHSIKKPLENTYGMLLYSKLQLANGSINYRVENDIPSITAIVILPSGVQVKLFCVHPTPPVPNENPRSTERDKELLLVAKEAKTSSEPVIVIGDLNDVAWSYTTELFIKISGLLDPRRGRGFFNSFHAKYFFLRFPLDHVFCSREFSLINLKRLPSGGSDHFPMLAQLLYDVGAKQQNEADSADMSDIEMANEKIREPTR